MFISIIVKTFLVMPEPFPLKEAINKVETSFTNSSLFQVHVKHLISARYNARHFRDTKFLPSRRI